MSDGVYAQLRGVPVKAFMNVAKLRFSILKKGSRTGYCSLPHKVVCSLRSFQNLGAIAAYLRSRSYQDMRDTSAVGHRRMESNSKDVVDIVTSDVQVLRTCGFVFKRKRRQLQLGDVPHLVRASMSGSLTGFVLSYLLDPVAVETIARRQCCKTMSV